MRNTSTVMVVASADRVVALRADAGKPLSNVNREGLVGLHDRFGRLVDLLNASEDTADPVVDEWWTEKKRAAAKRAIALRALT